MRVDARIVVGTISVLAVTSLAIAQSRDSRLVDAVKNGDRQVVQTLLKQKVDVNAPQPIADVVDTVASSYPDPERLVASADRRRHVSAAMNTMSPLERVTFALRHFDGCSINEIAQTVGISNTAAKQHIFRAVRKMRVALEPHWSGR